MLKMHLKKSPLHFKYFLIVIKELIMMRIQVRIHLVQIEDSSIKVDIEPVMICLLLRIFLSLCFRTLQIHSSNIDHDNSTKESSTNRTIKTCKEIL